ncbi:hypothetical protein [Streptacidiphilus carbonis]|uniref:hypothetical protein n=1 Tax=Streptacidiphilus carbonis TaxID=105422 RepID=UPI0005A93C4C|nr:hypothetical protein [Streptacidiphilus carbonis]
MGLDTLLFYRVDEPEHERRTRSSAASLDDRDALDTLLTLPVGLPVQLASLDRYERAAVRALPAGAVTLESRSVVRQAVRPLRLELAVVRATGWRSGLDLAGRFAPFCARAMLLDRRPARLDEALTEASFYGVGVLAGTGEQMDLLLEPRVYRPERHTSAAWRFVEELYPRLT